jgi:hypothetical protein
MERKESLTNDSLLKLNNYEFKSIKADGSAVWSDWSDELSEDEESRKMSEKSSSETDEENYQNAIPMRKSTCESSQSSGKKLKNIIKFD